MDDDDYNEIFAFITEQLRIQGQDQGIHVDMNGFYKEVFVCQNLRSFLWFLNITNGLIINSKEIKQSAINEGSVYSFFTTLSELFDERFHRQSVPKSNGDLDTAHWRPVAFNGHHVVYEVDLLSACLLYNRQYVLHHGQTEYDLALMCQMN